MAEPSGTARPSSRTRRPREPVYATVIAVALAFFRGLSVRIRVNGGENLPATGGAVLAINHFGYLDFTFAGFGARAARRRLVRFMAKQEVFRHPVAGPLMRGMKHIPVDRSAGAGSYKAAVEALAAGELVGVFPEATIDRSFTLKDFKTGAVRMAAEAGVPIVPVIVWGSHRLMTKGRERSLQRGIPVTVAFGPPLHPRPADDPIAATEDLKTAMTTLLDRVVTQYPDTPARAEDAWWLPAERGGGAPTRAEAADLEARERAERGR